VGTLKGEYQYALDEKGRVVIPPKFRHVLGDQVVATRGIEDCVSVYSTAEWARVEQAIQGLPPRQRDLVRYVMAGAADLEIDRQGRIMLPPHLRQHAKIKREVVVVGLSSRLEIWSRTNWQTHLEKARKSIPKIAEQIEGLSI
jgi:MraZ protein